MGSAIGYDDRIRASGLNVRGQSRTRVAFSACRPRLPGQGLSVPCVRRARPRRSSHGLRSAGRSRLRDDPPLGSAGMPCTRVGLLMSQLRGTSSGASSRRSASPSLVPGRNAAQLEQAGVGVGRPLDPSKGTRREIEVLKRWAERGAAWYRVHGSPRDDPRGSAVRVLAYLPPGRRARRGCPGRAARARRRARTAGPGSGLGSGMTGGTPRPDVRLGRRRPGPRGQKDTGTGAGPGSVDHRAPACAIAWRPEPSVRDPRPGTSGRGSPRGAAPPAWKEWEGVGSQ